MEWRLSLLLNCMPQQLKQNYRQTSHGAAASLLALHFINTLSNIIFLTSLSGLFVGLSSWMAWLIFGQPPLCQQLFLSYTWPHSFLSASFVSLLVLLLKHGLFLTLPAAHPRPHPTS